MSLSKILDSERELIWVVLCSSKQANMQMAYDINTTTGCDESVLHLLQREQSSGQLRDLLALDAAEDDQGVIVRYRLVWAPLRECTADSSTCRSYSGGGTLATHRRADEQRAAATSDQLAITLGRAFSCRSTPQSTDCGRGGTEYPAVTPSSIAGWPLGPAAAQQPRLQPCQCSATDCAQAGSPCCWSALLHSILTGSTPCRMRRPSASHQNKGLAKLQADMDALRAQLDRARLQKGMHCGSLLPHGAKFLINALSGSGSLVEAVVTLSS